MKSKIQNELMLASKCEPDKGEKITNQDYMAALVKAVGKISDAAWDGLSEPAQDWFNDATDAFNKKKDIPDFPDLEKEEDAPRSRRRASADADEPKTAAYEPKKGDEVVVVTKKGREYSGVVVDPDDSGELVIDNGKDELGIKLDNIESVKPVGGEPEPEEQPRSRRRKADDEPEPAGDPEVGDTVQITNKRGAVKMGNVVEIDETIIVIKDAAGEELEFDRDRVEKIEIKAKGKAADEGKSSRRRASASDDKGDDKGEEKSGRAGGGQGLVIREMILDDLEMSKDKLIAAVKKKFPDAKDNTIGLVYTEVHKIVGLLRDRKMMK